MLKILINAYACSPNMGSEPGMAWNWVSNVAKFCDLYIFTEGEFRSNIEKVVPTLEQGKNMHFYYNPVSDKIRKMCWNQGDWRFYWYYNKWQKKTLQIAKEICSVVKIDVIHQLNMVGFREPGYLWKIETIPFVWGPIGGMEMAPLNYLDNLSFSQRLKARIKNILNDYQRKHERRICKVINHSSALIAATKAAYEILSDYHKMQNKVTLINETGCLLLDNSSIDVHDFYRDKLHLIWVGRFIPTKKLDLALETMVKLKGQPICLDVVGTGTDYEIKKYKDYATKLGVNEMVTWHGAISNADVLDLMRRSDIFFFTSILESTSTVILEAITCHLPIICFNACGFGPIVDDTIGRKINISKPSQSSEEFAKCILELLKHRDNLSRMSVNCQVKQKQYSWATNVKKVMEIYEKITDFTS